MRPVPAPPVAGSEDGSGVEPPTAAAPGPLCFTGLRLAGFKSFSDPVELAIEGGLTGIVGPNGCGKSNIVEALRWVMGESSAKGLRGAEMDDVIFNGTGSRAGFDVAEVRLKLDAAAAPPILEQARELEIARRIARSQGSVYRVNGREVRARDVQLLFADAGAGARSPAIVGQGQVGFIIEAAPAERRRLLEDAAGIGGLHGRRREAEGKLRETRANLQRVTDLVASQAGHLGELERQDRQAARYRELAAELRSAEALLLLLRLRLGGEALAAAEVDLATAATADKAAQDRLASLRARRGAQGGELPALRARLTGLREQAATLRERRANLEAAATQRRAHRSAVARAATEAAVEAERQEAVSADARSRQSATAQALAAAAIERQAIEAALPRYREAAAAVADRLGTGEAAWREASANSAELERDRVHGEDKVRVLDARAAATRADLAALPATMTAPTDAADDAGREVHRAREVVAAGEAALQVAEAALDAGREAAPPAASQLQHATTALASLDAEIAALEAEERVRRARQQDLVRQRGHHGDRCRALAEREAAHRVGLAALDSTAAMARRDAADLALAEADAALDRTRTALATAEGEEQAGLQALRDLDRAVDAVRSEIKVLGELAIELPADAVLREVRIPPEHERAVAAALGDDLLVSTDPQAPARWLRLPRELDAEPLPAGVVPLATLVEAPAILQDRLARVGIVEAPVTAAVQASLRPGQRLVARDGTVWRWDGLVRQGDAETSGAARLRHRLRLDAAQAERRGLEAEREGCATDCAERQAWCRAARAALETAQNAWRGADAAQLRAAQALTALDQARDRLADEARAQIDAADALALEAGELASAEAALGPDPAGALGVLRARRGEAASRCEQARAAHDAATGAVQRCETERAERAQALREALAAQLAAQTALEGRRREIEAAVLAAAAMVADRAARQETLEADLARLAVERAAGVAEAARIGAGARAATARCEELLTELATVRSEAATAASAFATAEAKHADAVRQERDLAATRQGQDEAQARTAQELERVRERRRRLDAELAALPAGPDGDETATLGAIQRVEGEAEIATRVLVAAEATLAGVEADLATAEAAALEAREAAALAQSATDRTRLEHAAAREAAAGLATSPAALMADPATVTALEAASVTALEDRAARLRTARDRMGPVNLLATNEARELRAALETTRRDEAELHAAVGRLEAAIARLNREGRERLEAVFAQVDEHFRDLFGRLFGGGRAQLRLVGAEDPLQAGLELEACPPGKKLTGIGLLSGGEKTLTALALVFAFFLAAPSPLCVLDEVDAPLDDANVDRFVSLMREIAAETGTRFLVVTHHPLTMARTDRLYGVTMTERGVSRLVSVVLEEAVSMRAIA